MEILESIIPYRWGELRTYITFRDDTTGMIRKEFRGLQTTVSAAENFRIAFQGEYTDLYPMLGIAESRCLEHLNYMIKTKL